MKPIGAMAAAGGVSWLIAALVVDQRTGIEILFGMLGPLAATPQPGRWLNGSTGDVLRP